MKYKVLMSIFIFLTIVIVFIFIGIPKQSPEEKYCLDMNQSLIKIDGSTFCLVEGIKCDLKQFIEGSCPSCEEICKKRLHPMCVGHFEISGKYPNCYCRFQCEIGGVL